MTEHQESLEVMVARIDERMKNLNTKFDNFAKDIKENYVRIKDFNTFRQQVKLNTQIIYGAIGVILLVFLTAVVQTVYNNNV